MYSSEMSQAFNSGMAYVSARDVIISTSDYVNSREDIDRKHAVLAFLNLRLHRHTIRTVAQRYSDYSPLELQPIKDGEGLILRNCDFALKKLEGLIGERAIKEMEDAGSVAKVI